MHSDIMLVDGQPVEYRRAGIGRRVVVVLHGGHMSASGRFGDETFTDAGLGVLAVSRPGYGATPLTAGPSVPEFVPRVARLVERLGVEVAAAVGLSIGARSALTLAAFYPALVPRLVLLCPVGFSPWPVPRTRRIAQVAFRAGVEGLTWGLVHRLLRWDPERWLPRLIGDLSTLPAEEAVRRLGADREKTVEFLLSCRSGHGFLVDLRPPTDITGDVHQPTLVLATSRDGSVAIEHSERLAAGLPNARLVDVATPTHLLWLGENADRTRAAIQEFMSSAG